MGHSSDSSKQVVKDSNFTENASVTDTDQWIRNADHAIVTLPNPDTSISAVIRSGTKIGENANYDGATGTHSYSYLIHADKESGLYYDDFQAKDVSSTLTDPAVPKNTCTVYYPATPPPGGNGGG